MGQAWTAALLEWETVPGMPSGGCPGGGEAGGSITVGEELSQTGDQTLPKPPQVWGQHTKSCPPRLPPPPLLAQLVRAHLFLTAYDSQLGPGL